MAAPVPIARPTPVYADAQISASVRGRTWRDLAMLHHWIRAHGQQLIPAHRPGLELEVAEPRALRYRMHPSGRAIARVWQLQFINGSPTRRSAVDVTFPDGAVRRVSTVGWGGRPLSGVLYVEPLEAKSAALTELELLFNVPSGNIVGALCVSVACWELPRAALTVGDAVDLGIDVDSLRIGAPIYDDGADDARSVAAIASGLADSECRRVLHAHATEPVFVTSADLVELYPVPLPIVPRRIRRTDVTAEVWAQVYAYTNDPGTEGFIEIESLFAGGLLEIDVTSDTPQWLGTGIAGVGRLPVMCEDLSTADGAPAGGIPDLLAVRLQRVSGSGAVVIESVCVWEGPPL